MKNIIVTLLLISLNLLISFNVHAQEILLDCLITDLKNLSENKYEKILSSKVSYKINIDKQNFTIQPRFSPEFLIICPFYKGYLTNNDKFESECKTGDIIEKISIDRNNGNIIIFTQSNITNVRTMTWGNCKKTKQKF